MKRVVQKTQSEWFYVNIDGEPKGIYLDMKPVGQWKVASYIEALEDALYSEYAGSFMSKEEFIDSVLKPLRKAQGI